MQLHNEVELSALGMEITTSTVEIRDGSRGRPISKAKASFDAFFGLLTKYCFNKYDSVVQSFLIQGSTDATSIASDVAKTISKEMPVELLRASLPHTSEQQRKLVLEFAQRSMPDCFYFGIAFGLISSVLA